MSELKNSGEDPVPFLMNQICSFVVTLAILAVMSVANEALAQKIESFAGPAKLADENFDNGTIVARINGEGSTVVATFLFTSFDNGNALEQTQATATVNPVATRISVDLSGVTLDVDDLKVKKVKVTLVVPRSGMESLRQDITIEINHPFYPSNSGSSSEDSQLSLALSNLSTSVSNVLNNERQDRQAVLVAFLSAISNATSQGDIRIAETNAIQSLQALQESAKQQLRDAEASYKSQSESLVGAGANKDAADFALSAADFQVDGAEGLIQILVSFDSKTIDLLSDEAVLALGAP